MTPEQKQKIEELQSQLFGQTIFLTKEEQIQIGEGILAFLKSQTSLGDQ